MQEQLTLNNGTVLENSYAFQTDETLWVYIGAGLSIGEVFDLFRVPENVTKITNEQGTVYEGYDEIMYIRKEKDGTINAGLREAV